MPGGSPHFSPQLAPRNDIDWAQSVRAARAALLERLAFANSLTPAQIAATVCGVLPPALGGWLYDALDRLHWLTPAARIPFDALDAESCPVRIHLPRAGREFVRLAVFGPAGEGRLSDSRRREAVFQQRCGEIMREARDLESLTAAASRALGHPEVHGDHELVQRLRQFIAEREADIHSRAHLPSLDRDEAPGPRPAPSREREFDITLAERVRTALTRLRLELEGHLADYNEDGAQTVVEQIRDLFIRYPGQIKATVVRRCEEQVQRLTERRGAFTTQLKDLKRQAIVAADAGDQKAAAWVIRRLSAIHTLLPAVLEKDRFERFREEILDRLARQERHEAAHALVEREQQIGQQIKRLGAMIHRYHKLADRGADGAEDADVHRRAREEYERAVDEFRSFDDDWLADLMVELEEMLEDLAERRDRAEVQVDKFLTNVRVALTNIRREIQHIQRERAAEKH